MGIVRKAVITAAGRGTRQFPATRSIQKELLPLVDRDGVTKPTIQIIIEECLASGIEDICVVVSPGGEESIRRHFSRMQDDERRLYRDKEWALAQADALRRIQERLHFVEQPSPEGFGHAVYQAREFVGDEPFLLMLGDHIYISEAKKRCAQQVIETFGVARCAVSAVQQTPDDKLHLFGTVTGHPLGGDPPSYDVTRIVEKPTIEFAAENLQTTGVKRGYYLCFFGITVFPPSLFDYLRYHIDHDIRERGEIQLTSSQEMLRANERYVAVETRGARYDMGVPNGYIETQMALALHGVHREEVLASLLRIVARSAASEPFGQV
ncbi:MAG: sugar phosphate nucleotidyltransferase [Capsulimonadales bacterium]|nr:sugar phosphate nucleotidyltransferase [Capsulimonadales bacterium]